MSFRITALRNWFCINLIINTIFFFSAYVLFPLIAHREEYLSIMVKSIGTTILSLTGICLSSNALYYLNTYRKHYDLVLSIAKVEIILMSLLFVNLIYLLNTSISFGYFLSLAVDQSTLYAYFPTTVILLTIIFTVSGQILAK